MKESKWPATRVRTVSLLLLVAAFANTSLAASTHRAALRRFHSAHAEHRAIERVRDRVLACNCLERSIGRKHQFVAREWMVSGWRPALDEQWLCFRDIARGRQRQIFSPEFAMNVAKFG
jgi:hypothetical protein